MVGVMVGQKFGHLTVVKVVGRDHKRNLQLECQCTCGKTKLVRLDNLRNGKTQSCGCYGKRQRSRGATRKASERARARYGHLTPQVDEATIAEVFAGMKRGGPVHDKS
jgi:hypothetical protein